MTTKMPSCSSVHTLVVILLLSLGSKLVSASRGLNYGDYESPQRQSDETSSINPHSWGHYSTRTADQVNQPRMHPLQSFQIKSLQPGPKFVHHVIYWLTAEDAIHSVIRNEYTNFIIRLPTATNKQNLYSKLFYFARLRPRLLFSVGALLRALQLCTPFRHVLDPSVGVGAGVNLCAIFAGSRWVKPVVLGWTVTKWAWIWLGARQVDRAFVPITLSLREWDARRNP